MRKTILVLALGLLCTLTGPATAHSLAPSDARAFAKEAYIYGFPMVDNYRVMFGFSIYEKSPEFKAPLNQLKNESNVATPEDKTVQTPNSDTPYSLAWLDLRAEPIVLTVPPIDPKRYFSVQLIDAYTFNFGYLGSRATGNEGGSYLLAGPGWAGEKPVGVKAIIRAETEVVFAIYRTQLFDPEDLGNVKAVQAGYKVEPLSKFLGQAAPAAAPQVQFIPPLKPEEQRVSPAFFDVLAVMLQFCPVHPSEKQLRSRFTRLGIVPGKPFTTDEHSSELRDAIVQGMADGQKEIDARRAATTSSADMFGTREQLKNDYVARATAAQMGIYGNTKEEALYPVYQKDADGQPLDAAKHTYVIRFSADRMPPVNAFWSVTMYDAPAQLLVANPINRYLINSPMLPQLKLDADGGLTLYIQHDSPGAEKESNWLPAPNGPFFMAMRLYWPKPEALDGRWTAPKATRVD